MEELHEDRYASNEAGLSGALRLEEDDGARMRCRPHEGGATLKDDDWLWLREDSTSPDEAQSDWWSYSS